MIGVPDLLSDAPEAARPTPAARFRRAIATALALTAALLGATPLLAVAGGTSPAADARSDPIARASVTAAAAPTGAAPSDILAVALASPWRLIELSLRPDGHASAVLAARFEAPRGRPARPEQLVASLSGPAVTELAPVAIVATADGTAVDVAGRLIVDTRRRTGSAVPVAALAGGVSRDVIGAGGGLRRVRTIRLDDERTAASIAFDATPGVAVAVLAALEEGVSAPARMTSMLVRRVDNVLSVELTLTPRALVGAAP